MPDSTKFKTIFNRIYIFLVALFIVYFVIRSRSSIAEYLQTMRVLPLLVSATLTSIALCSNAGVFIFLQKRIQAPKIALSLHQWMIAFFYGYMGRYIPGKVSVIAGRMSILSRYGVSKKAAAISAIYETIISICASLLFSIPVLLITMSPDTIPPAYVLGALLFTAVSLIVILSPLFEMIIRFVLRCINRRGQLENSFLRKRDIIFFLGVRLITMTTGGLGFWYFCVSLNPIEFDLKTVLYFSASLYFAGSIGIMAIFAPGGIGVREGILVLLLSPLLTVDTAILLSVAYRLFLISVEITFVSVLFLLAGESFRD
jgi:glycosyltransferase 2 family protein